MLKVATDEQKELVLEYKAGLLVNEKFSRTLSKIFGKQTANNHQKNDLKKVMKKFISASKDFQKEYDEIARKHGAEVDPKSGELVRENGAIKIAEDKMEEFNKECDALFNKNQTMTFENGRHPFNDVTLADIELSASDLVNLDVFHQD